MFVGGGLRFLGCARNDRVGVRGDVLVAWAGILAEWGGVGGLNERR